MVSRDGKAQQAHPDSGGSPGLRRESCVVTPLGGRSRHTSGFCRKEFLEAPASNASGISSHAGRVEKKTLFCGLRNTPSVRAHKQRSSLPIQSIESCSFHCRLVSSAKIRRHANPARPCPARTRRHKECRLVYRTWSSKVVP